MASRERQRADKAEGQIKEMMDIPEIKELWDRIQQNKKDFLRQLDRWINDAIAAIRDYAQRKDNDFQPKQGNTVAMGIIAEAFKRDLDPADGKQRKMATGYLLERMSWTDMSEFKAGLTAARTRQLCDAMTVSKELMQNLLLMVGGRGGIGVGGGGSSSELTNWDGTKKKTGWEGNVMSCFQTTEVLPNTETPSEKSITGKT
ncbi:hypothetical protein PL586_13800 [Phocaeicola vulgatus]|nr:hypothetical protein [Phocaeicola vulgatus]